MLIARILIIGVIGLVFCTLVIQGIKKDEQLEEEIFLEGMCAYYKGMPKEKIFRQRLENISKK